MGTVEARTPKTAALLLLVVLTFLFAPLGIIVSKVVAQSTIFSRPGVILVSADPLSDAVAATPAEFRVDESGAATYSVPIFVVPGTAGVAPRLSLNYSSQGGYGPMGRGWSIGGLSAISRCRATREAGDFLDSATQDGDPRPINFGESDHFCLDGQRLVLAGTNTCRAVSGMVAQELRTEIESFRRTCVYQPSGGTNGPAFFTVEGKDGSISWYGDRNNNDSSNRPDGYVKSTSPGQTANAISWVQTRFQDSTGNTIDYHYLVDPAGAGSGEHLIKEVRFTGKVKLPGQSAPASEPFARTVFNYSPRPASQWIRGYVAGGQQTQSQRLDSVTSCATIDCQDWNQVRHYRLGYQTSPSGSGSEILNTLQECRSNQSDSACATATSFEWGSAKHEFTTTERPGNLPITTAYLKSYKMADVNGDGRQDFVYVAAGNINCSTNWLSVGLGTLNAQGQPTFIFTSHLCLPAKISDRGDGAWHLFDYDGDGRDDLFVSGPNGQSWRLYRSLGESFDSGQNLIAGLSIPSLNNTLDQVQLADLNGDGLIDIVYPASGGLKARLMVRQSGGAFAWDASERSVAIEESSLPPMPGGCGDQWNPDVRNCQRVMSGMPTTKAGFVQLADLNGDAASDLLLRITTSAEYRQSGMPGCTNDPLGGPSYPGGMDGTVGGYWNHESMMTIGAPFDPCWTTVTSDYLHALVVKGLNPTSISLSNYGALSVGNPESLVFGDVNGDGLTDAFLRNSANSDWYSITNTGTGFTAGTSFALTSYRDQVRFADANGDGRTDMLHVVNGPSKVYYVRYALAGGGFGPSTLLSGGNARICEGNGCDERLKAPLFSDFDGDGIMDFMSIKLGDNADVYVSRSNARFTPRDTISSIKNGLGSITSLTYAPLTNIAVYRRASGSRNISNWGRGSPVTDFLAPMYVVSRASSSSPQPGNPSAMASVHYRYADGRMQAGGRGFLGFGAIETIDPNQSGGYIVTRTTYHQNFPFVGMPMQTTKKAVGGAYIMPACLTGTVGNSCFGVPGQAHPDLGGSWFSDSHQVWEVAPASLAPQAPLHVRTIGSDERLRDPFTGEQTSRVATAFEYGTHGNVTLTAVDTYTRSETTPSATVTTWNTYADDVGKWRLGRLTASTVTHRRPGQPDVVRSTGFSYQMSGAATGLLTEERLQPGGAANLASAKTHQLDDYGNRLQTTTCAGPATPCSTSGFQFHPVTATQIKRYARVTYDEQGRFPTAIWEPFWTPSGGEERQTTRINGRDVFGEPMNVYDANNVHSFAVVGQLGRQYYAWQQTTEFSSPGNGGVRSLTTYRKCDQVACPTGAAFRQQVETTGAPRQWTYFDVLGRPVMQAAETFNVGVANEDVSATCTEYTLAGQPRRVSNPFFLSGTAGVNGPTGISSVCSAAARKWTTTTYDALGRAVQVQGADGSVAGVTYFGLTTTKTDPRGNQTEESRNGLGEIVSVVDAAGTTMRYDYFADGAISSVWRDVTSGMTIANFYQYDVLGRKIRQVDPETNETTFEYNALGELTAQVNYGGSRIEHAIDARGRIWRTAVKNTAGSTETESTFTYDIGTGALGKVSSQTITGTYAAWSGQPGTTHNYRRDHYFDALGRPQSSIMQVDGQVFGDGMVYDALGRPWQAMDVSGLGVKTEYGSRGHAQALCSTPSFGEDPACAGADTFQRTLKVDAWGNVTRERRGNLAALEVARTVWAETGRVASICAGNSSCNLVKEQYGWDAAGNMSSHLKEQRYLESFTYDNLNRLKTGALLMRDDVTVNQGTLSLQYDALGNICSRSGTVYEYGVFSGCTGVGGMAGALSMPAPGTPHAVRQTVNNGNATSYTYDGRGNQLFRNAPGTANDRTIAYSLDDKAHEILMGSGQRVRFWYGPDGQRYKREEAGKVTYYLGGVEAIVQGGITTFKRYVGGVALQVVSGGVVQSTKYLFHDHLGSLVRIANADGSVAERLDYMAFGGRRSPTDPHTAGTASANTPRGYTGHEYVDGTGVIHMNGRIYDSELGRFLQADPVIQAPNDTQSWNAYTYVFNNPFAYTDPTGMISWKKVFRAVVGIVVAIYAPQFFMTYMNMSAFTATVATGFLSGAISTGTLKGAVIGAFIAGLTYGIARGMTGNTSTEGLAGSEYLTPSERQLQALNLEGPRAASGTYRINIAGDGAFLDAKAIGAMDIRTGDIVFTNGIKNSFSDAVRNGTTQIFQTTGGLPSSYVLNYNPTTSFMGDIIESGRDLAGAYLNSGHSGLAKSLAQTVHVASQNGVTGLQLIGHSQGGAITASALRYASANGMSMSALQGGSVALHGAPINNIFATRYLSSKAGVSIATRAQFGDIVNNVLGFNFLQNPMRLPAALVRSPGLFSNEIQISPHTSPCLGQRSGLCN